MTTKAKLGCAALVTIVLLANAIVAVGLNYLISFERGLRCLAQARVAMDRQDCDAAIAKYSAALEQRLTTAYQSIAYQNRGTCESRNGQRAEAIRDYGEAIRRNPKLDWVYQARGFLYEQDKVLDKAFTDYSEAIRLNPNAAEAYFRRGLIYKFRRDDGRAIADFSEAARCQPSSALPYLERGECYFRQKDLEGALASFDAAINIQPDDAHAHYLRGQVYRAKGEMEKAKVDLARATELSEKYRAMPTPLISNNSGQSIAELTQTLQKNPTDKKALEARGLAYSKQGSYKLAVRDFSELLQVARSRRAFDFRAWSYSRLADYSRAIADYKQGQEESGPVTVSVKELAWLLATCPDPTFRDGKQAIAEATEDCERTAWKSWNCLDTLAAAYAETGDFTEAVKFEQQALGFNDVIPEEREELQKRLALYQTHQPFRDGAMHHD